MAGYRGCYCCAHHIAIPRFPHDQRVETGRANRPKACIGCSERLDHPHWEPVVSADKHTPGPWIAVDMIIHQSDSEKFLGAVTINHLGGPTRGEAEANAKLMAAAPDLLEAAKKALMFIVNGRALGYITIPEPGDSALETPGIIRAAIAKAEGGDCR
jgi:hypothetical protein